MDEGVLERVVADLDELVSGDGARFALDGWDEAAGVVRLSLVIVDATCADCVVPRPMLESIALERVRSNVPSVARVAIDDPRER